MAPESSQLYSKNISSLLLIMLKDGKLTIDPKDDVIKGVDRRQRGAGRPRADAEGHRPDAAAASAPAGAKAVTCCSSCVAPTPPRRATAIRTPRRTSSPTCCLRPGHLPRRRAHPARHPAAPHPADGADQRHLLGLDGRGAHRAERDHGPDRSSSSPPLASRSPRRTSSADSCSPSAYVRLFKSKPEEGSREMTLDPTTSSRSTSSRSSSSSSRSGS